ncbi:hypothetical protein DFP73DRAFT_564843 [Morchella snyderi]|nr:hypothetical protein DFP73DRAFT_564843 [Morchella snyderi]
MNPAESIIAMLQLTEKITSLAYRYIDGAREASKDLTNLSRELRSLAHVLQYLQAHIKLNPQSELLRELGEKDGLLPGCLVDLQRLQSKMEPKDGLRGVLQRMKWPLQERQISRHILRIERYKRLFTLVIQLEQKSLLEEISKSNQDNHRASEVTIQDLRMRVEDHYLPLSRLLWLFYFSVFLGVVLIFS